MKIIKKLITIIVLTFILFFVIDKTFASDNKEILTINEEKFNSITVGSKINYKEYITDKSESNTKLIEEFISEGMNINNFKNTLTKSTYYIESTEQYKKINYDFERHYSYEELEKIYLNLVKSDIVKLEVIGKSFDGRNLYSIEIGTGKDQTMFEGNIHAAEIAPALYLTKYAVDLVNSYESGDKEAIELLKNHKIIILPSANPDGYDYSVKGKEVLNKTNSYVYINDNLIDNDYYKANINGVDLNRNFPTQTGGLYYKGEDLYYTVSREKSTKKLEYFPGDELGSEPETQAMIYWMYKNYKNTHAYIAVHSAGRVVYDGEQYLSNTFNKLSNACSTIVNEYSGYFQLGIEADEGQGIEGTSTDMIGEIAHGYKFSTETGRLSTSKYGEKAKNMEQEMCVLTIETLENYTKDLDIIKEEYYDMEISSIFSDIVTID